MYTSDIPAAQVTVSTLVDSGWVKTDVVDNATGKLLRTMTGNGNAADDHMRICQEMDTKPELADHARVALGLGAILKKGEEVTDKKKLQDEAILLRGKFYYKDGLAAWFCRGDITTTVGKLVFRAHDKGGMAPDDRRMEYVVQTLDRIVEAIDYGEDLEEVRYELYPDEIDTFSWLASHSYRPSYVDEELNGTNVYGQNISEIIQMGMRLELEEVYDTVLNYLEELCGR